MKNTLLLISFLLCLYSLQAQRLIVTYATDSLGDSAAVTRVYLQSAGADSVGIRAINFSIAFQSDCAVFKEIRTPLTGNWTQLLERVYEKKDQDLVYGGKSYDQVVCYGHADPGMPTTRPFMAPPEGGAPALLLEATFSGTCAAEVYVEDEKENRVNQQGDLQYNPVEYEIQRE